MTDPTTRSFSVDRAHGPATPRSAIEARSGLVSSGHATFPSSRVFSSVDVADERSTEFSAAPGLGAVYEEHGERLLRLCVLLTGRQDGGEDLVQDTFVRVAPRLHELTNQDLAAYLRTTALNLWRNQLRRSAIERRRAPRGLRREEISFEDRDLLWQAIRNLPPRQRACVVLRYYEDLSERDTASLMGCSVGTVKSQTSRAIRRLRREVALDA